MRSRCGGRVGVGGGGSGEARGEGGGGVDVAERSWCWEGPQWDMWQGEVVLMHKAGQLFPRHNLMLLSQLVYWDELISWRQRGRVR